VPWYSLVGHQVGRPRLVCKGTAAPNAKHPRYVAWWWYGGDSPHLALDSEGGTGGCIQGEQARPVKTVKVRTPLAEGATDQTVGSPLGKPRVAHLLWGWQVGGTGSSVQCRDRYRLGHRPVT